MQTYTDKHTGKVYALGQGYYSRTVTQYPAGTKIWFDGSATAQPTGHETFATQAQRTAWLRMMGFVI